MRARHGPVQGQAASQHLRDRRRPSLVGRRQREPGRRPGRPRRRRRCSSRSPTRRSPTAARSCAPTSGLRSTPPTAPCCSGSIPPRRATSASPRRTSTRFAPVCTRPPRSRAAPRPTCSAAGPRASTRCTARPERRSTRPQADQSWYVCYVPDPTAADPRRGHGRAGRLRRRRRRPGRAADPLAVVLRQAGPVRRGDVQDAMSVDPIQMTEETAPPRRRVVLLFDPLLLRGGTRAGGLLAGDAARRDQQRDARPAALLRRAPGDLRGDRDRARGGPGAAGLLAAARIQVRHLRR